MTETVIIPITNQDDEDYRNGTGRFRDDIRIYLEGVSEGQEQEIERLRAAVHDLYRAAYWTADRPCDAERLWEAVRDAAGIKPGKSPKKT